VQHKRAASRLAAIGQKRQLEHIHCGQAANDLLRLRANGLRLSGRREQVGCSRGFAGWLLEFMER